MPLNMFHEHCVTNISHDPFELILHSLCILYQNFLVNTLEATLKLHKNFRKSHQYNIHLYYLPRGDNLVCNCECTLLLLLNYSVLSVNPFPHTEMEKMENLYN